MKTQLGFLAGIAIGLAVAVLPANAENRPAELPLFQSLNGEVMRDLNAGPGLAADGGGLTLWSMDAGPGCNTVRTGAVYEMHCNAAVHFCPWGNDGGVGLAVCGTTIGNVAYGRPVAASSASSPAPFFFVTEAGTQGATKSICITPASTAAATCALFRLK